MATINTNMPASIAANSLTRNDRSMTATMERLSTGLRINSAKDDAAGLAITSRMSSQIRGLDQAVRNANDAISMIQVAEGAMKEVTNMFQRMRELAVQAISDSNTSSDRAALNNEYKQLSAEVQRIAENTQWNGQNILDGARTNTVFQVGANASQTIAVNFGDLATNNLSPTVNVTGNQDAIEITFKDAAGTAFQPAAGDVLSYKVTATAATGAVTTHFATVALDDYAAATADVGFGTLVTETTAAGAAATEVSKSKYTHTGTKVTIEKVSSTGGDKISISDVVLSRGTHAPVAATDITTRDFASTALGILDTAVQGVNDRRATLGASMSRLEFASDNLQNVAQNTKAARSRVLDADYASETTELARTQIIQQAGTAMLSQANQAQQSVLALLK
jgi:flagellin